MRKRSFAIVAMMLLCTACAGERSAATESFVLHESSTLQGNTYGGIALTQDDVFYFDELEPVNLNYLELVQYSLLLCHFLLHFHNWYRTHLQLCHDLFYAFQVHNYLL